MLDTGLAPPGHLRYRDCNDDTSVVASLYNKAIPMPDTIPDPATLPIDLFFDQVIQAVRRQEARLLHRSPTASAPPPTLLAYPCACFAACAATPNSRPSNSLADGSFIATSSLSLLAPEVTLRSRAARQYILLRNLQQLAAMLHPFDAEPTLCVLLHDLRRAVMFREGGACYEDAEGMVWRRAKWRIEAGIVDQDQTEDALRLLQAIIGLGMDLLRNIDWRHSRLVSMITEQTGIDL